MVKAINAETKKFRLTSTSPLLGSVCLNKQVYTDYIAEKGKTEEEKARAKQDVDEVIDSEEERVTGFYRDRNTNCLCIKGYQIKGFLKAAAKALKDQINLAAYTSKIDNLVFVVEETIPLMRNGEAIQDPDTYLERPLRAETAQGPRVSLAKSEMVEDWYADVTIKVIENKGTAKSVGLDMDIIEQLLSYGEMKGLLQWRNAGYGSFTFEEIK